MLCEICQPTESKADCAFVAHKDPFSVFWGEELVAFGEKSIGYFGSTDSIRAATKVY